MRIKIMPSQGNLWKKGTVGSEMIYTYLDSSYKHAVTHLGGAPMYSYDPNGNMTTRTVGTTTHTQSWDAENRLVGAGVTANFARVCDIITACHTLTSPISVSIPIACALISRR